jgi:protein O-GlcNAc transferase
MFHQINSLMQQAFQYFEKGNYDEAGKILTYVLNMQSKNFDALHLKGIILGIQNKPKEAQQYFKKAVKINPENILLNFNYAKSLTDSGDDSRAINYHLAAIKLDSENYECWINYGISLDNLKRYEDALTAYDTAIGLSQRQPLAWFNRAKTLIELTKYGEAIFSYEKAIEIDPMFFEAWFHLGAAFHILRQYDRATVAYDKALELRPDFSDVWSSLGNTLNALNRHEEALASCDRAISINPDLFEAWSNKGNALKGLKKYDLALASYEKSISLEPGFFEAWYNRGDTLYSIGQHVDADLCYRQAIRINPNFDILNSNFLFNLNYIPSVSPEFIVNEARQIGLSLSERAFPKFFSWNVTSIDTKLRIGFVSGDFRKHPVGYFILGLLENLDPNKFEIYCFPTLSHSDDITENIKRYSREWLPIYEKSDFEAATLIHNNKINILIDLAGHTSANRLPVFSYKPAPVQITWLGLPVTTGLPEIDYVLGDSYSLLEEYEIQFTEKLWRLPDCYLCLKVPYEYLSVDKIHKNKNKNIVFGSFNNISKINDLVIEVWSKILMNLPNTILLIKNQQLNDPWIREKIRNSFSDKGIDLRRLQLTDATASYSDHLATYNKIDIALDTFPYPGVTTSVESLFMGVPVLSLRGNRFLSSTATSIAVNSGLSDWVADDIDDYVNKAINFASDSQKLADLRLHLQKTVPHSALFDSSLFSKNFGDALMSMWSVKSKALK